MLKLPQITLIAVTGKDIPSHQKAIDESCKGMEFGAVKLVEKHFDTIDEWSEYIVYDLYKHVETEFALLIHADGYVIHPELWDDEWLKLDYIGSPWPLPKDDFSYRDIDGKIQRVGNGVSLRSFDLLELPSRIHMEWKPFHGFWNEDGFISVNRRHVFEEHGMKFGTFEQALRFGKEHELPEHEGKDTFLFHSL